MSRFGPVRPRDMTRLEKLFYLALTLVVLAAVALIAFGRAAEDGTRAQPIDVPQTGESGPARSATTAAEATPAETTATATGAPPCDEVAAGTEDPAEPITCSTRSATLTIVGARSPVLLDGTEVRFLSAALAGREVTLRLRVRNETEAEQGVNAGGQELYLNLGGLRVDAEPIADTIVAPGRGETVSLRFRLTPARLELLRRARGRAELGVKPWDATPAAAAQRGVIRFGLRLA